MKQRFVWIISILKSNFNSNQLMHIINFLKEEILYSNRYYNHHDLHLSIEILIQFVSYELRSRISSHMKSAIAAQQLIITDCFENFIENITENSILFALKNLQNLHRHSFSSLHVNAWNNNMMLWFKRVFLTRFNLSTSIRSKSRKAHEIVITKFEVKISQQAKYLQYRIQKLRISISIHDKKTRMFL